MYRLIYLIILLFCCNFLSGQSVENGLDEKIKANKEKLKTSPEEGFIELEELIGESRTLKDKRAELKLLSSKYEFHYFRQIDFNQMFNAAKELQAKAKEYNDLRYQALAHKFLAMAYLFSDLEDKAELELEKGFTILSKADADQQDIINEKANLYTFSTNIHTKRKDYKSAIAAVRMSVKEHNKLTDPEQRRGTKFMDYCNLGAVFLEFDLDSAAYYANKSISLSLESEADHNLNFLNYIVLGRVEKKRKNYQKALYFFEKAENITNDKHFINIKELYRELIEIHEILGNQKEQDIYKDKLRDLELTISKNQNTALQGLLKEKEKTTDSKESKPQLLWLIIAFLGIAGVIGYAVIRNNQKKGLQQLQKNMNLSSEQYKNLIELIKANDTSFLLVFEEYCPEFTGKLQKISSELTNTEIDLLAMVKLKLTNKEIAQYRFVQPKTIQNRRHRIRKKLNLSNSVDLDKWVEEL